MKMNQYKTKDYNAPMMFFFLKVYKVTEKKYYNCQNLTNVIDERLQKHNKKLKIKVKHKSYNKVITLIDKIHYIKTKFLKNFFRGMKR